MAQDSRRLGAVPSLILSRRTAGDLPKDPVKLRVAAESGGEGRLQQSGVVPRITPAFIPIEEALHALTIAELDDREPCLLFEEAAEP